MPVFSHSGGLSGARQQKRNAWHRLPWRATRTTNSLTEATTRATAQNGNGENTASLSGGGAATVPEGRVCDNKNGRQKLDKMGPAGKPVGRRSERSGRGFKFENSNPRQEDRSGSSQIKFSLPAVGRGEKHYL